MLPTEDEGGGGAVRSKSDIYSLINTEEKAKVVTAVWGTEYIALAILH